MLDALAGRTEAIVNDRCVRPPIGCGKPAVKFRDGLSRREFTINKGKRMTEKRWHPVGSSGNFKKWTEKGQFVEGIWEGTTIGKFGDLGIVKQSDGLKVTFPLHTVLADRLKRIREGAEIHIEYLGKDKNQKGVEFKNFEVMVGDPKDIISEAVEAVEGEETPF